MNNLRDKKMKFWSVKMSDKKTNAENGTITDFYDVDGTTYMGIACDGKLLLVDVLQVEGKGKMLARDFKNGQGKQYIGQRIS
mgnify:FL=1